MNDKRKSSTGLSGAEVGPQSVVGQFNGQDERASESSDISRKIEEKNNDVTKRSGGQKKTKKWEFFYCIHQVWWQLPPQEVEVISLLLL